MSYTYLTDLAHPKGCGPKFRENSLSYKKGGGRESGGTFGKIKIQDSISEIAHKVERLKRRKYLANCYRTSPFPRKKENV